MLCDRCVECVEYLCQSKSRKFVQYTGHTVVHTQQFSNVISYVFFKAQACSETEVVVDDDNFVFFINFVQASFLFLAPIVNHLPKLTPH